MDKLRVHHRQEHTSANPCAKCSQGSFRLVRYDTDTANRLTQTPLPVLVQRHSVGPGTFLDTCCSSNWQDKCPQQTDTPGPHEGMDT
ncbi:hypothetical protein DPEC_G00212540 [Dallia pectoralis]|uniref:Uncharacterized protein n=1 Tax=Dallia pectoralis TaxID=75939 RepID=A0ACC2G690_DALPE|nr:hypothetical protein DPEC_G00212540 [Dallia pectoralis]